MPLSLSLVEDPAVWSSQSHRELNWCAGVSDQGSETCQVHALQTGREVSWRLQVSVVRQGDLIPRSCFWEPLRLHTSV